MPSFSLVAPQAASLLVTSVPALHEAGKETFEPDFQPSVSSGAAKEQLFDQLHMAFMQAKHQYFVCSPQVWQGAMLPSVDTAKHCYKFTELKLLPCARRKCCKAF